MDPMMQAARTIMVCLPVDKLLRRLNWNLKLSDPLDMTTYRLRQLQPQIDSLRPRLTGINVGEHVWVRIEWQTLTRLPRPGAILFKPSFLVPLLGWLRG